MPYDSNEVGVKGNIFGYPYTIEEADLVLIQVPWDVTVSYGSGTASAPELILEVSTQLDFSTPNIKRIYKYPVAVAPFQSDLKKISHIMRLKAERLINLMEHGGSFTKNDQIIQKEINISCDEMVDSVKKKSDNLLNEGKVVGLIGGDHSTPLGLIQSLGGVHSDFGILQIDAHLDLRNCYEGFVHSHASIMHNVLGIPEISRLVQVGARDYCEKEEEIISASGSRIEVYFDETLQRERWSGVSWSEQVQTIAGNLPQKVYISFDMDGLEPSLCPKTGTPVPGGLSFNQAVFLIEAVVRSGREIIGFDISETGHSNWDANVAARILFRLCAYTGISRDRLAFV